MPEGLDKYVYAIRIEGYEVETDRNRSLFSGALPEEVACDKQGGRKDQKLAVIEGPDEGIAYPHANRFLLPAIISAV